MAVEGCTHRTWPRVAARLGCCVKTAKKRVKLYKIPVMRINGQVELDEVVYQEYLLRRGESAETSESEGRKWNLP
ncbi:MAG: hypothetical protein A2Z08_07960 [Deltaproteobacteria bacterium RBG_16_54_11]|nr:MAG: hypothetical protein A2Z08_07960 [Deltaproteobacteria bacterium RBG_16_54_11]